jgi:hypothetical protein
MLVTTNTEMMQIRSLSAPQPVRPSSRVCEPQCLAVWLPGAFAK